jgi:hypothetical protein
MLKQSSNWLGKISTGPVALAGLVLFLAFTALVLPGQSARAEIASQGADSPDTSFVYAPADLYAMAEAYGPDGRAAYIRARFTFDLAWPLVYTLFLVTAVGWIFKKAFPAESRWQLANLAPVAGALFDFLENITAALVMERYPASTPVVDLLAPIFTALKWSLLGASFLLLLAGACIGLWKWTAKKRVSRER